ncbi:MAG TPA: hypothetical protein VF404_12015 [Sphingomonas sp.]
MLALSFAERSVIEIASPGVRGRAAFLEAVCSLESIGWFDMATIAALADDHRFGRAEHGRTLWQLMMLERSVARVFG